MQYVKIPDGEMNNFSKDTLDKIESETNCNINVNQEDGNLSVSHKNSVVEFDTKNMMEAISLGFSFEKARELVGSSTQRLDTVDIKKRTRNEKEYHRQKGRVIGENGKCKRVIHDLTDANIVITGHKVGLLGELNDVLKAKKAVNDIISGRPHSNVYAELERYKRNKNQSMMAPETDWNGN